MWIDYYLKFNSYEQFYSVTPPDLQTEASPTHATDIIGTLYRTDTFEPLEGFHVNLRLRQNIFLPAELDAFNLPTPNLPKRIFA